MTDRLVCAVMAGGSGTRFWPVSRRDRPKQLLSLLSDRTLLRATCERIVPICPPTRQLIITSQRLVNATRAELPDLHPGHVLGEPAARNTAPCMALAAIAALQIDPNAVLALLPADHHIAQPERFRAALTLATAQAEAGFIVTLGITPTHPETGFGYIELADPTEDEPEVFGVRRFVEKPDLATATTYLMGGRHLWNGGVFVLRADVALAAVAAHLPAVDAALAPLRDDQSGAFTGPTFIDTLGDVFPTCPSISIDYGIMEHRSDLRAIALHAGWSDVGSWRSLLDQRAVAEGNFERGDVLAVDCADSVLVSQDGVTLTAVGLRGMAVVATGDAVLAVPLDRSQDVREVVEALTRSGRDRLL